MIITLEHYFLWFLFYSFVGWMYESILVSCQQHRLVNRGFLNGPLCPIYGTGAILGVAILGNVHNPIRGCGRFLGDRTEGFSMRWSCISGSVWSVGWRWIPGMLAIWPNPSSGADFDGTGAGERVDAGGGGGRKKDPGAAALSNREKTLLIDRLRPAMLAIAPSSYHYHHARLGVERRTQGSGAQDRRIGEGGPQGSSRGETTPAPANLVDRDFTAERPNEKWLTDITEIKARDGKVYLSPMIPRPLVHSGCHYRWPGWLGLMERFGLTRSMSAKGCSPDNAAAEGFFGRMKTEAVYPEKWEEHTRNEVLALVDEYIRWYNHERIKQFQENVRSPSSSS